MSDKLCVKKFTFSVFSLHSNYLLRRNVPDYTASREKNDLGFINFDLKAGSSFFSVFFNFIPFVFSKVSPFILFISMAYTVIQLMFRTGKDIQLECKAVVCILNS